MTICRRCSEERPQSDYCKDASRPSGHHPYCKQCRLDYSRARRGITPDRYFANAKKYATPAEKTAAWRRANPDAHAASLKRRDPAKASAAHKRWRDKNVESERQRSKRWAAENPARAAMHAATRRAALRKACPPWADREAILKFYEEAQRLTETTGIPHHVDHIMPLQGRTVRGLHVPMNLQVITASENASKGNRLIAGSCEEKDHHY